MPITYSPRSKPSVYSPPYNRLRAITDYRGTIMEPEQIAVEFSGLYRLPGHGGEVAVPVNVLGARRTGHVRVDLLVTPTGGFGEFWIQQSSFVECGPGSTGSTQERAAAEVWRQRQS